MADTFSIFQLMNNSQINITLSVTFNTFNLEVSEYFLGRERTNRQYSNKNQLVKQESVTNISSYLTFFLSQPETVSTVFDWDFFCVGICRNWRKQAFLPFALPRKQENALGEAFTGA